MTSGLKGLGRPVKEERFANLDLPTPPGDPVPLPSRRPVPTKSNDVDANWLRPLAFVNLREGPSPSARVVSVVAKGAKLRVIGRKGRWVQVDPLLDLEERLDLRRQCRYRALIEVHQTLA